MSRTCSTSRIQRLVIQAQGQIGSNQKSAVATGAILPCHDRLERVATENLTRDEARERARLIDVATYDVHLDLTTAEKGERTFESTSEIAFSCREPGAAVHVDITADAITEATLNGTPVDVTTAFNGRRLQLTDLAESNTLRVVAECVYMRTGEGLHRFTDVVDGETYLYTQFEAFEAHRMFACFDQPDIKASFRFVVDAPEHWVAVSNMPGSGENGHWEFEPTPRQSSYITALVAGPYHSVHDEHDGIPLGLYCRQSMADFLDAEDIFTITKQGFDYFHEEFGYRYPWPKYDQLFVPEFNAGAMENAGCVTFLEDYLFRSRTTDVAYERRAVTILHEMAHMWFGDLVTMRWWDDLWLNESFAEFVSTRATAEATRWPDVWTTFCNVEKAWAYRQDQLPTTHPIASDIVDIEAVKVNFDGITYAKGASVLKQLAFYVGQDAFTQALRGYFRRHEFNNTTLQDLLDALADASGRDLSTWSKEWLQTAGVNTLRPQFELDADGNFASFAVLQETPEDYPTLRSHRLRIGLYDRTGDGMIRRSQVELDVSGAATDVPALVGQRQPDLVLLNDDDLTYAKIRLDDRSLRTLVDHVGELREPMPRALCWTAAWDMARDAEMRAGDYLALVLAGIEQETETGTVASLLRLARQSVVAFGDPAKRASRMETLANRALELLESAEPGSDRQLDYARGLAANATTDDQLAVVAGLLSGERGYDGLAVDTELRWALLQRLVIVGRAAEDEISAELERDETAAGRRHSLTLRAARPTPEAKEEAWALAFDDELPNAEQASVIAGFSQYEQAELLAPYVDRYFAAVEDAWENKTSEMAQQIAVGLYPVTQLSQHTLDTTDRFLREQQPTPALRRLVTESRDGLARALRAQAFDTAG
ncbi:MAG: aminopeptidase N [Frankiales bacterium]|nr:aminopeptidase N [Frankiales bacterium]